MGQAERITTAIRELMSRGHPPKSTNPLRAAHAEFIGALAGDAPHPIHFEPDLADLKQRADHLEKVLAALHVYVTAIIAETAQSVPASPRSLLPGPIIPAVFSRRAGRNSRRGNAG
jgi:hypothetical protein